MSNNLEVNRRLAFNECHLNKHDKKRINCHHIYFKSDERQLPQRFQINSLENLVPLPIETHKELHEMVEQRIYLRDISTRVYLANMAFNSELDLVPDRIYYSDPRDMMRKWRNG